MAPIHDAALWAAYAATRYVVFARGSELVLRVGARSDELDRLLDDARVDTWCFVTAWNPGSERLAPDANRACQRALEREVEAGGWATLRGEGRGEDGDWPAEESLLVFGIDEPRAVSLGRAFGQVAIVFGERGGPARLVDCRAVR